MNDVSRMTSAQKRYLELTDEACSENGRIAEEFVRDDGILGTCLVITADGEQ
jgi:hypothetical protein